LWNKKNVLYFKSNYLDKKIKSAASLKSEKPPPEEPVPPVTRNTLPCKSRINLFLPKVLIQEVIGAKELVIIEYIIEQVIRRIERIP